MVYTYGQLTYMPTSYTHERRVWSSIYKTAVCRIESVQREFTNSLRGLSNCYDGKSRTNYSLYTGAESLEPRRLIKS